MEGSSKVHLQFVHSSVKSDFGGPRRQSEQRVKGDDVVCYFEINYTIINDKVLRELMLFVILYLNKL